MADSNALLVPIQLQAFSLNPAVCGTGQDNDKGARIIPITQPNYTFLRLDNFVVQSDVLNHADLHNAAPASSNSRMTDLGSRTFAPRRNRHGIYLHWILPQLYRSGVAATDSVSSERLSDERLRQGLPDRDIKVEPKAGEASTPEFLAPPTRWIVVRKLNMDSIDPAAKSQFKQYQAWVIESDYRWTLDDIPLSYDLEVDVSPYIVGVAGSGDENAIDQQAEVFIGRKTPLEEWSASTDAQYADIDILRSGNQLFADFQLHNTNVFSILDNFEYKGPNKETCYLDVATASYYLLGWHSDNSSDPLWDPMKRYTHEQRLDALFMTLADTGNPDVTEAWLKSTDPARLCLHGAMYDVKWDHKNKPASVPADDFSQRVLDQQVPSFSVGTTPLDALMTYCSAREGLEKGVVAKLEEDLLAIDSLLHARDDGVEGQREAKDTVYNWNFSRFKGGAHFFFGGQDSQGQPTKPTDAAIDALNEANQIQRILDACRRLADQWRWDMFSTWWKFVSTVSNKEDGDDKTKTDADAISQRLQDLSKCIAELETQLESRLHSADHVLAEAKSGTLPFYYSAKDPTLLVGGVDSGWPTDFSNNVPVRLPVQTVTVSSPSSLPPALSSLISAVQAVLPLTAASQLLTEFYALQPCQLPPDAPTQGHAYPHFHEKGTPERPSRDNWGDQQPWFPLYVEWEVEYTHVPYELWVLDEQTARLSANKMVRYGVDASDKPLWQKLQDPHDTRILSGRVLILPQPSFSLKNKVTQLISDTPPQILDQYLEECGLEESDLQELVDNIGSLSYLSCPLSGITQGLLTLSMGAHIKPENKQLTDQGETVVAVKAAEFDAAGLTKERIELIMGNSSVTPFAAMVSFSNAAFCPFKPVTHGQMAFRKLNIIDKFGQAIVAIDPQPQPHNQPPPPLFPGISDFYEPQAVLQDGTLVANAVQPQNNSACEFIQLPPQINQPARLNADFIMPTMSIDGGASRQSSYWRSATEWENPIWGWIVVNYADYGIQLFLQDGTFYGEVRIGGPGNALEEPKWSPFEPDKTISTADALRLDALILRLKNKDYLKGVWAMLTTALDNLAPAPDAYAQFLSCTIGKPLALVNMGWSLELAGPPLSNQSTRTGEHSSSPERDLVDDTDPNGEHSYVFHVKLGDKEREYDGLVGYFDGYLEPEKNEDLNYDMISTYFTGENLDRPFDNLRALTKDTYPTFKPYWLSPMSPSDESKTMDADVFTDRHNAYLHPFGAIVDPFTAVHGYSSFLPAKALQLPAWTWQSAMQNLMAFFHWGPVTLTSDVGPYSADDKLTMAKAKMRPGRNVSIPGLGPGDEWNWLQPYDEGGQGQPSFNAMGIEKRGNLTVPGFQKAPYTAIEGFLQLRRPVMQGKGDDNT
ncbi:hypothetical protein MAC_08202 [Metarhizium acridum CQMa 102]|uniref:Uncharacterized protein n=1 Tax=Metarhizium acridum (strain CQMa 102) TaxID=655827 RepID=E9EEA4_METAQ|nr:uncharacterized protein MAC_08202 [Metarhizium acridum CQMa 102]EFY85732.1 hypothetical protein MAC_08202 [Metarhizium acridum CQMa 102]